MTKLVAITQGRLVPSTRFRWGQYLPHLELEGFDVTEFPSAFGAYPPEARAMRPTWIICSLFENAIRTQRANGYDLRFLQRNLTSTLCTWEPFLRKPLVFDVDDSIFLGPRGTSANKIARSASLVICGNSFLANHFIKYGRVVVLPTAVDANYFLPRNGPPPLKPVIGWSGSSSGFKYLRAIEPAIRVLLRRNRDLIFKIVSDRPPVFESLPQDQVVYETWSVDREVAVLQEFSVGIMPLMDDLWARGKCSFKMLTYMSAGLPVVVSPYGMNDEVLAYKSCGFGAKTLDDWVDAISTLIDEPVLALKMGRNGRDIVEKSFSIDVIAPQFSKLLREQT